MSLRLSRHLSKSAGILDNRRMPPSSPSIAVIIPALNERSHLTLAVESATSAEEVIVVDGGSSDGTDELARELPCVLIVSPAGRGRQLREGVRQSTADVLLFLHADCRLAEGALDELRAHAAQRSPRLFGAYRQRIDDDQAKYRWLEWGNALRATKLGLPYGDQAVFIDRTTYMEVGGFADVPLMEDLLLARAVCRTLKPELLNGPVHVSARRWQRSGVWRRTCRNQLMLAAFFLGVSPERLAEWY